MVLYSSHSRGSKMYQNKTKNKNKNKKKPSPLNPSPSPSPNPTPSQTPPSGAPPTAPVNPPRVLEPEEENSRDSTESVLKDLEGMLLRSPIGRERRASVSPARLLSSPSTTDARPGPSGLQQQSRAGLPTIEERPETPVEELISEIPRPGTKEFRALSGYTRRKTLKILGMLEAMGLSVDRRTASGGQPTRSQAAGREGGVKKRKEPEPNTPSPIAREKKRPRVDEGGNLPSYAGATSSVAIALVPDGYPQITLEPNHIRDLLDRLFDKLDDYEPRRGPNPKFDGHTFKAGGCLLYCRNESSRDWVREVASDIVLENGIRIRPNNPESLVKVVRVTGFFPGKKLEPDKLLKRLMLQNEEIDTCFSSWQVIAQREHDAGTFVVFRIPEIHLDLLRGRNFSVDYRDRRIFLQVPTSKRGRPAEADAVEEMEEDGHPIAHDAVSEAPVAEEMELGGGDASVTGTTGSATKAEDAAAAQSTGEDAAAEVQGAQERITEKGGQAPDSALRSNPTDEGAGCQPSGSTGPRGDVEPATESAVERIEH